MKIDRYAILGSLVTFVLGALFYVSYAFYAFPFTEGWGINYISLMESRRFPYRDFYFYLPPVNLLVDGWLWDLSGHTFVGYRMCRLLEIARDTFTQARAKNLKTAVGGAISPKSTGFLGALRDEGLIDNFETRKVVFVPNAIDNGEVIFKKALEFELLWLKSKRRYYSRVKVEDESRIAMLEKRLNG